MTGILLDIGDWILVVGRFHPVVVHLPIGILAVAASFEGLAVFKRFRYLGETGSLLWAIGALAAVASCIAGFALAEEGGYDDDMLTRHQWAGVGLAMGAVAFYFLRRRIRSTGKVAGGVITLVLLVLTGHFGGSLTHGATYFTDALNTALGMDAESIVVSREPIGNIDQAVVFSDLIAPVLEQKCYGCHSTRKQKGGLRLDDYSRIMAGGKNGAPVVPGDESKSELYRRLLLSDGDKKKMPPDGKPQLTDDEITLIGWWIREGGASPDRKVEEVVQPERIASMLASYRNPASSDFMIPADSVSEPDPEAIKNLEAIGVHVSRISADLPFVSVNCVTAPFFDDENTQFLLPLQDQIIWLNAGNTALTNEGLAYIGQLRNLMRLSIENTGVTDDGIAPLKDLSKLRYLNLVGTRVTDRSLESIIEMKSLERIYLWKSDFSEAAARKLREMRPELDVNIGEIDTP